ncbi:hypothetical protein NM688_g1179 [Phlebia brevispora]|uniref:Uncharacterized protein n=1 Tax=Phlebia brevispora TaxID=194682 RepID=A0ACC1TCZ8_9APHY|nr:hypothetical protein NM688_g1179 [Phlebia brevispora]
MVDGFTSQRKMNPAYKGKNGFMDNVIEKSEDRSDSRTGDAMQVDLPSDKQKIIAAQREAAHMRDAIEKHRKADKVLEGRGFYFPGMDAIKAELASEENAGNVKERMIDSQKQFQEDMSVLYDLVAEDYLGDAMDAYYNLDDHFSIPEIEQFYERLRRPDAPTLSPLYSLISEVRYAHCYTLQGLQRRRKALLVQEEAARKARDAQFPADISAYRSIANKDIQLRIARFLTADAQTKERMLTEFNWVYRQVKPLGDAYAQNAEFKAEIQERVRDLEVKDPRRKTSMTLAA